jgi:hypothetical protein
MKQNYLIELPDNCKVIILFHSLDVAVPVRLAPTESSKGQSAAVEHYEVRFPKSATIRIVHSAKEFSVKIAPLNGEFDCDDQASSSEEPSPSSR